MKKILMLSERVAINADSISSVAMPDEFGTLIVMAGYKYQTTLPMHLMTPKEAEELFRMIVDWLLDDDSEKFSVTEQYEKFYLEGGHVS